MNYLEVHVSASPELSEILIAELADLGFESFTEEADGLNAYIVDEYFDEALLNATLQNYAQEGQPLSYRLLPIPKQNWNAQWEQNYEAIEVAGKVRVRASFHPENKNFAYEIVINPKMSFGTGHHETTAMMLAHQLDIDHTNKTVMDVGSGTGILAIMAEKRGAKTVTAFDIEEWATLNAIENLALNHCSKINVQQGTIQTQTHALYDIVLANINRNILLREIPIYATFMPPQAILVVSGFYEADLDDIAEVAIVQGFAIKDIKTKNAWAAVRFERN